MGKFVVKQVKTGVIFNLKADNGEVIATSEIYATEAACMNGIESIRRNAIEAKLEDQTVEGYEAVTNPKFEVYTDKAGEFRFRLKAKNGRDHCRRRRIQDEGFLPEWHRFDPSQCAGSIGGKG